MSHLFGDCCFPHLRDLFLEVYSDLGLNSGTFTCLLERTPTIETLGWYYLELRSLQTGSLPNLKQLCVGEGSEPVYDILADTSLAPRRLESLGQLPLNERFMSVLENVDRSTLRKLEVTYFASLDVILDAVRMFPQLTWLRIPSVDYMHDYHGVTQQPIYMVSPTARTCYGVQHGWFCLV